MQSAASQNRRINIWKVLVACGGDDDGPKHDVKYNISSQQQQTGQHVATTTQILLLRKGK